MIKAAAALLIINALTGAFEYRETSPSAMFPYNIAVSDDLPLGHLSNPAYLPLWKTYYLNADFGKPYWMEEVNSGNLRMGWGFNDFALQAGWSTFGIKEYREDVFSGSFGYMPFKYISLGAGVSYYHLGINTDELNYSLGVTDYSASILIIPSEKFHLGFSQWNIVSAFKEGRDDLLYPAWSCGATATPVKGISFSYNLNRLYYGYVNSFSVSANLIPFLNLRAGYSRETSSYTASVIITHNRLMVLYGLSHQSYLGITHNFGITISGESMRFSPLSYNKKLIRETFPKAAKPVNINESSYEELIESGIFPDIICERIVKYREIIGPVTEDALIQIGLSPAEFKAVKKRITGVAEKKKKSEWKAGQSKHLKKGKTGYTFITLDQRQDLFKALIEKGISATESLFITEKARGKTLNELIAIINGRDDIPDERKKIIIKLCKEVL